MNLINALKITLIVIGLLLPYEWYLHKWETLTTGHVAIVYLFVFAICVMSTISAAFCTSKYLRLFYALFFAASILIVDTYQIVMGEFFLYISFVQMIQAVQFAGDAISQYGAHTTQAIVSASLIFLGLIISPSTTQQTHVLKNTIIAASPIFAIFILSIAVMSRGGTSAAGMPGSIIAGAYGVVLISEHLMNHRGPREAVTIPNNGNANKPDIVLLVDESVRGNYLDIGGGTVSSGLLDKNKNSREGVYNYGIAASAVNCSNGSNLILRYGGTRENYQKYINSKPSIWEYARIAGYRTVYLDAQQSGGRFHNEMNHEEAQLIDDFIQYGDILPLERDQTIAKDIAQYTLNNIPELIYVNKIGAHFPVHDKYPDEFMIYKPASKRGTYNTVSDARVDADGIGEWDIYRNAYRNTLLWNVDNFFKKLLPRSNLSNTIIIYTSDHGQNFREDGSAGFSLHCSNSPSVDEGIVPMVVITKIPKFEILSDAGSKINFNGTSHYNIFPTLLGAMNYDKTAVERMYGRTLFEQTNDPLTFNSQFSSMIGSKPNWVSILQ